MQVVLSATRAVSPAPHDALAPPLPAPPPSEQQEEALLGVLEWSRQVVQIAIASFSASECCGW